MHFENWELIYFEKIFFFVFFNLNRENKKVIFTIFYKNLWKLEIYYVEDDNFLIKNENKK